MRKLKAFKLGWCVTDHHGLCRGAVNNPGGTEKVFHCSCRCHRGKTVTPVEEIVHAPKKGSRHPEQLEEFISKLLAFGRVEVDLPENESEIQPIRSRMNNAGTKAQVRVRTKIEGSKIVGWVPPIQKPKRKRVKK